jgi:polar amino acid transport system substrate-binding protein
MKHSSFKNVIRETSAPAFAALSIVAVVTLLLLPQAAFAVNFLTEENPPLNFSRGGQVAGVSTDVVRELAKRAGLPAEFSIQPWTSAYARTQEAADTCIYSTVRNNEREKLFQWVGPIGRGDWSLIGRAGFPDKVKRLDELKSYRVGVVNDARVAYLRSRGFNNLVIAERNVELAAMLTGDASQLGRIDLWMTQSMGAAEIAKQAGVNDAKMVFSGVMSQDYWLACNPRMTGETVQALSQALTEMRKDGSYLQIVAPQRR